MAQEHKWYIIHTSSGSEKRVKQMILDQAESKGLAEYFEEIVVPIIEVPEIKRGKPVKTEKKFMPGYVLIKMIMDDKAWHLVKNIPKITGFLGGNKSQPKPLKQEEVQGIFAQLASATEGATSAKLYQIGEQVVIIDGPFDGFIGVVEDVDSDKQRLRVSVAIFGKATPIDLNFTQVKKN